MLPTVCYVTPSLKTLSMLLCVTRLRVWRAHSARLPSYCDIDATCGLGTGNRYALRALSRRQRSAAAGVLHGGANGAYGMRCPPLLSPSPAASLDATPYRAAASQRKKRLRCVRLSPRIIQGRCLARGYTTSLPIHLPPAERHTLRARLARGGQGPQVGWVPVAACLERSNPPP